MKQAVYVYVMLALTGLIFPDSSRGEEESSGTSPTFEPSAAMAYYRALCSVDPVGGAGVGNCFKEQAKTVQKKFDLLHSRLTSDTNDMCHHQKLYFVSSKKAYKTYVENMCRSADVNGNTHGFVERQHCILELTVQGYKNLLERSYTIEKARECED
ncbi:MAG: hypothetical protein G8345_01635 [Magnetococcales bacterium]|nr:hypothetical protein [Magnetococcales bacterium]NGZ25572.1 hypothetical protein [Magnetococcales bacterium]